MTIANRLHGKKYTEDNIPKELMFEEGIYIFEDGSKAKLITKFEKCEPYQNKSTVTSSVKQYLVWKAIS